MNDLGTTLVAVATPPGKGGVGCVRISGPEAFSIAVGLFRPRKCRRGAEAGELRFGRFLARDGLPIDHGYLVLFGAGRSFTGEPCAELWAHGSDAVLRELVEGAVASGAMLAGPGEFTYRALRNGRLDLARAEAIRDLVAARTLHQARTAYLQAEGALSRRLKPLRERLLDWVARGEAAVEFADESEVHLPADALEQGIGEVRGELQSVLSGFEAGRLVREGATVAITGAPNVGKSSLFNRLLDRDRAIVSVHPGTTRDTLEETVDLEGIPVRLVDTAGLRSVSDPVEGEGVRRAREASESADGVLLVLDGSRSLRNDEREALRQLAIGPPERRAFWVVVNKADLPRALEGLDQPTISVSAATGTGLAALRRALREGLGQAGPLEHPALTDVRHARALEGAASALGRAVAASSEGIPLELVLEDLREALQHLGLVTGEFATAELYDRIFTTFCIGK